MGKSAALSSSPQQSRSRPVSSLEARYPTEPAMGFLVQRRQAPPWNSGGLARPITLVFHDTGDQGTNIGFVIDNEYFARHAGLSYFRRQGVAPTSAFVVSSVFRCRGPVEASVLKTKPIKAPPPGESPSSKRPSWSSMIFFTMARPNPVPLTRLRHVGFGQGLLVRLRQSGAVVFDLNGGFGVPGVESQLHPSLARGAIFVFACSVTASEAFFRRLPMALDI